MAGDRSWLEPTSSCSVSWAATTVPAGLQMSITAVPAGLPAPDAGRELVGGQDSAAHGSCCSLGFPAHGTAVIGGSGGTARHSVTRPQVIRPSLRFGRVGDGRGAKNDGLPGHTRSISSPEQA